MSFEDFKYSKLKNLSDLFCNFENYKKNELESFSRQLLEDLLKSKQNILSVFNSNMKEYFQRVKLESEISTLYKKQTSVSHKLSELRKMLQTMKEEKESKDLNRDNDKVLMYEKNLAIRIEPTSDIPISEGEVAVSFDFHHINDSSPHETCSFVLIVTNGNRYKVYNCHPSIAGMDELLSTLNYTNDLHKFIVSVRKGFQESFIK